MNTKPVNHQNVAEAKGPGVSELLKTTRERAGEDLERVSQVLRIRLVYLQAIEEGRYEDLPGKTYVVGFVRAYAEHLGLDVDEVVNRFKHEVDGLEAKAELVFPSPATEQSVPGGALILISLIIAGLVYGGWYLLSSQERDIAELVPDLPAKFSEMIKKDPDEEKGAESGETQEPAAEPTSPAETMTDPVSPQDAGDMAAKALEAVESAPINEEAVNVETVTIETEEAVSAAQDEAPNSEANLSESAGAALEEVEDQVQSVVETEEAAPRDQTEVETQTLPSEDSSEIVEEVAQTTAEEQTSALEDEAAPSDAAQPQVIPAQTQTAQTTEPEETTEVAALTEEAPTEAQDTITPAEFTAKIVLKAVDYSWIQLIQSDGTVVHTQALNQGDEFETPKTAGLILRTGNAGGLEIFVDDEKVPAIGGFGEVRRRVLMDPERLKSGQAVER